MKKVEKKDRQKVKNSVQVTLGSICYPKAEVLIIPSNMMGIMSAGRPAKVIKDGLSGISKEVKQIITNNKVEMGGCFFTGPGRLNRRGLKKICHSVIKRLQSDFVSIYIIKIALTNAIQAVIDSGAESVAICGIGIEAGELDKSSVARITMEVCEQLKDKIKIKIIDDNEEYIKEINYLLKE